MALSKSNIPKNGVSDSETISSSKSSNNLVVRVNQDSDDNLQALFDSVLNPGDSKRPLQVPFRMRKLPNSFFNPPASSTRPSTASHSRANSADSAYDTGSQSNVNQTAVTTPPPPPAHPSAVSTNVVRSHIDSNRLTICHSRAHSSPASLQQTYGIHSGNVGVENTSCVQDDVGAGFDSNITGFGPVISATSARIERLNQCIAQGVTSQAQAFHIKQRSYDVISPIQLQNELGPLPPGWEQAKTNEGQIYYLNHNTKTTQWEDPRIQYKQQQNLQLALASQSAPLRNANKESLTNDEMGSLPEGWEQAFTESGDIYFINHIDRTTSWNDPRITDFLHKTAKINKSEINWGNERPLHKMQDSFKQKTDQNVLTRPSTTLQVDPFLSGDSHARQESSDSGLSLSSNTFSVNTEFISQIDDSMDCISESGSINPLSGLDCPDNLVSSLQLEDNICNEMFNDVHNMLNSSASKPDNLEWYKIN